MRYFLTLLAVLVATFTPGVSRAESFELTPEQATIAATNALSADQPQAALTLANALLRRDPNDFRALLIRSRALRALGRNDEAQAAAKQAWQNAESQGQHFGAALVRAQALASADRDTAAQFWLRQASQYATTREQHQVVARDYRVIRARNPLSVKLSFGAIPSSNINGGANNNGGINPITGEDNLSGDAQALTGYQAFASGSLSYRVHQSERSQTKIGVDLYGRWNFLSSEAQLQAPTVKNSDYTYLSASLMFSHDHTFETGHTLGGSISAGRNWYGGNPLTDFRNVNVSLKFPGANHSSFTLTGQWGQKQYLGSYGSDLTTTTALGVSYFRPLADRNSIRLTFRIENSDSAQGFPFRTYTKQSARVEYTFGKPILGGKLTASLGATWGQFDPVALLAPDGRQDTSLSAQLDLKLSRFSFYGFSPVVTIKREHTNSNISRYSTDLTSIGINFQSDF